MSSLKVMSSIDVPGPTVGSVWHDRPESGIGLGARPCGSVFAAGGGQAGADADHDQATSAADQLQPAATYGVIRAGRAVRALLVDRDRRRRCVRR